MGKRSSHRSSPPVYRFTPGIVERGETMTVSKKSFDLPESDLRPLGRRTLGSGRKVYSWDTRPSVSTVNRKPVTEMMSESDRPTIRRVLMRDETIKPDTSVTSADRARYGLPSSVRVTYSAVYVDENFHAPPSGKSSAVETAAQDVTSEPLAAPEAQVAVPVQGKPEKPPTRRQEHDSAIRQYLSTNGFPVVEITPSIRSAALDAMASQDQLAEYLS